ncbi:MAG TPA: DUF3302 domain-containing protein [Victivallales bacterium]|nr:DUF3302 domain-containing protein [Victivallales bacterium]
MLSPAQNIFYFIFAFLIMVFSIGIIIVGIIVIHDLPYKIAKSKSHPQQNAIRCMSIMGLILFPLWLLAMIWAYIDVRAKGIPAVEIASVEAVPKNYSSRKPAVAVNKQRVQRKSKVDNKTLKSTEINNIIKTKKNIPKNKTEQNNKEK